MKKFKNWDKLDKIVFIGSSFFLGVSIALFILYFKVLFIFNAVQFLINSILIYKMNKL